MQSSQCLEAAAVRHVQATIETAQVKSEHRTALKDAGKPYKHVRVPDTCKIGHAMAAPFCCAKMTAKHDIPYTMQAQAHWHVFGGGHYTVQKQVIQ